MNKVAPSGADLTFSGRKLYDSTGGERSFAANCLAYRYADEPGIHYKRANVRYLDLEHKHNAFRFCASCTQQ